MSQSYCKHCKQIANKLNYVNKYMDELHLYIHVQNEWINRTNRWNENKIRIKVKHRHVHSLVIIDDDQEHEVLILMKLSSPIGLEIVKIAFSIRYKLLTKVLILYKVGDVF